MYPISVNLLYNEIIYGKYTLQNIWVDSCIFIIVSSVLHRQGGYNKENEYSNHSNLYHLFDFHIDFEQT